MPLPKLVQQITKEAIDFLDPEKCFRDVFEFYHNKVTLEGNLLEIKGKLHLFGLGKAASYQVSAFKKLMKENGYQDFLGRCVSYTKVGHGVEDSAIFQLEGDHPVVSLKNLENTRRFIKELSLISYKDTLFFFLSGGGSALLELPHEGINFDDFVNKQVELLNSGKTISEMNSERKAMSQVKDGGLLSHIPTQNIFQFITSDIPSPRMQNVSSGPLLGQKGSIIDRSFVVQSEGVLLKRLCDHPNRIMGEVYDCSLEVGLKNFPVPSAKQLLFSGGEMPVTMSETANGKGGRNTHFVLALAHKIYREEKNSDLKIMSLATDGGDGPTDAAGAYIDFELYRSLEATSFLNDFNSYEYFEKLGTLIKTGPTRSNVMDLRVLWRE